MWLSYLCKQERRVAGCLAQTLGRQSPIRNEYYQIIQKLKTERGAQRSTGSHSTVSYRTSFDITVPGTGKKEECSMLVNI
jgi:hypothetical protein